MASLATRVPDASGASCPPESVSAPVVSVVTAVIWALVGARAGWSAALGPLLIFASGAIALSVVDVVRFRLPDRILFPTLFATAAAIVVVTVAGAPTSHLMPALVAGVSYFLLLLIPNLISPAGLAFGDVKLALLLGLVVGWMRASIAEALVLVIYAMMIGMLLGIFSGLAVGVGRRIIGPQFLADPDEEPGPDGQPVLTPLLRTAFPFGPALAASALAVALLSGDLINGSGLL